MNHKLHPGPECEQYQSIGVASSHDLNGPWRRRTTPVLAPDDCIVGEVHKRAFGKGSWRVAANPSVVVYEDDSVQLFYRGVSDNTIMMAYAQHWNGTYHRISDSLVRLHALKVEDMYVWRTRHGCNMLVHVQSIRNPSKTFVGWVSALYHAPHCNVTDFKTGWKLAMEAPYSRCILLPDRRSQCFVRRERPQLVFHNNTPITLCTAVEAVAHTTTAKAYKQFTLCSAIAPE
eukprot:NODE_3870_length_881_cov_42.400531_g3717_i0.p1 GENE.NODE_3870_length_881_cov_42.400531_g3717_i0~~NODE_3870_length_881_cov_42.400531_g3717_i0.p1  ORF type:complete len:267 (-),score=59.80 NODE_3870_length_881_cov_42.400531_g3717_i0:81-773(-)